MQKYLIFFLFFVFSAVLTQPGYALSDKDYYRKAVRSVREGNFEFAYMQYRSILNSFPQSKYREKATFANAEYYFFMTPNDKEARLLLKQYLSDYPEANGRLFALALLYRIASTKNDQAEMDEIEKQIATYKRVSLVFEEFEEYEYQSPFDRQFKAIIHIDKIAFYVEGELFAKISY